MAELHGASAGSSSTIFQWPLRLLSERVRKPAPAPGSFSDRLFTANLKLRGETNEILLALATP